MSGQLVYSKDVLPLFVSTVGSGPSCWTAPVFCGQFPVKTDFYIDGFNLYYLALRGTPLKWLDLHLLCQVLVPTHQVNRIRYFTTLVHARTRNPQRSIRQRIYLRGLETIPDLTVHYGHFLDRRIFRPLVTPIPGYSRTVEIWDSKEKGTDVNLASYLLMYGVDGDYEQAVGDFQRRRFSLADWNGAK